MRLEAYRQELTAEATDPDAEAHLDARITLP
jgi:hypothetical protein